MVIGRFLNLIFIKIVTNKNIFDKLSRKAFNYNQIFHDIKVTLKKKYLCEAKAA